MRIDLVVCQDSGDPGTKTTSKRIDLNDRRDPGVPTTMKTSMRTDIIERPDLEDHLHHQYPMSTHGRDDQDRD